jgi:hypothetical protein
MKTTKVVRPNQRTAMNKDHSRSAPGSVRPIRAKPDRVAFEFYVKIQTHRGVVCNPVYVKSKPIETVVCNPVYVKSKPIETVVCNPVYVKSKPIETVVCKPVYVKKRMRRSRNR